MIRLELKVVRDRHNARVDDRNKDTYILELGYHGVPYPEMRYEFGTVELKATHTVLRNGGVVVKLEDIWLDPVYGVERILVDSRARFFAWFTDRAGSLDEWLEEHGFVKLMSDEEHAKVLDSLDYAGGSSLVQPGDIPPYTINDATTGYDVT